LDILQRGSVGVYKRFLQCLHETNQGHVADIIRNGGGQFSALLSVLSREPSL